MTAVQLALFELPPTPKRYERRCAVCGYRLRTGGHKCRSRMGKLLEGYVTAASADWSGLSGLAWPDGSKQSSVSAVSEGGQLSADLFGGNEVAA